MTYQRALAAAGARIERQTTKIVTLDIERAQGRYRIPDWRGQHVLEGPFWDLSDGKRLIGFRLKPEHVVTWPRTITMAWRWYGQERIHTVAEWNAGGRDGMVAAMWDVLDKADIVVGHNVARFDLKKMNADFLLAGHPPPSPYKTVDTLTALRSNFGLESNTLASATERLGIPTKTDAYDPEVAEAALAGSVSAQRRLLSYNRGDIIATEALYDRVRPWIKNHPHVAGLKVDEDGRRLPHCQACGSTNLERNGHYTAQVLKYGLYRCQNCFANVADRRHAGESHRTGHTRGV